jgi:hypothetical protein
LQISNANGLYEIRQGVIGFGAGHALRIVMSGDKTTGTGRSRQI